MAEPFRVRTSPTDRILTQGGLYICFALPRAFPHLHGRHVLRNASQLEPEAVVVLVATDLVPWRLWEEALGFPSIATTSPTTQDKTDFEGTTNLPPTHGTI